MSKWIRGRRGRLIASMLSGLVLIALLLPLAPPPVYAQATSKDFEDLFKQPITKPVPIIVFDYVNRSTYKTGMLGRLFADALAIELLNTKKFDVAKREDVEKVLEQEGLSIPLTNNAQVQVAERMKCPYTTTGTIEDVKIISGRDGKFAEVTVSTLVISKITKEAINGARVVQRSSPKIAYTGNDDVLVQEALSTAAYQTSYKLLSNRLPIATVLTSARENEVQLRGGATIGLTEGMILTTIRRETVTGKIRLTMVNPTESVGEVLEKRGMALGDKAVPVFDLKPVNHVTPEKYRNTGMQIVSVLALVALAAWVGGDAGNNDLKTSVTPTAVSLADAYYTSNISGGNLVTWSVPHRDKIVAYAIYRDTNPAAPLAIVPAEQTYYIDSAAPLPAVGDVMENTQVDITIDQETGEVTFTPTVDYSQDLADLQNPDVTLDLQNYTITCHRVPLVSGQTTGYNVVVIWKDFDMSQQQAQDTLQYRLWVGQKGPTSRRVTLLVPPVLDSPNSGVLPVDGNYRCESVLGATTYYLQISTDSTFPLSRTLKDDLALIKNGQSGADFQTINYALQKLYDATDVGGKWYDPLQVGRTRTVYWRIGARRDVDPLPGYYADPNQAGWVYSEIFAFDLPAAPPRSARYVPFGIGAPTKNQGSGREDNRLLHRR